MNRAEVLELGKWLADAFPQQKWNEGTPDVWVELLEPFSAADGKAAAKALALKPGQRFVAIAELVEQIRIIRRARFNGVNPDMLGAAAPADDVGAFLEAVKSDVKAIGDGVPLAEIESGTPRPVGAVLQSLTRNRQIASTGVAADLRPARNRFHFRGALSYGANQQAAYELGVDP